MLTHAPPHNGVIQLSEAFTGVPPLAWLACQTQLPKVYWQSRGHNEECAAIGECRQYVFTGPVSPEQLDAVYQELRNQSHGQDTRYYGGCAFDLSVPSWDDFGRARFVLPRLEVRRNGQEYRLLLNLDGLTNDWSHELKQASQAINQIQPARPLPAPKKYPLLGRSDLPNYSRWCELVAQVTHPEFVSNTPKVVLSRISQLQLAEAVDPWSLLALWQGRNPNSYQFAFQFADNNCFISCSPERLFKRRINELSTEALAGTTTRGNSDEEDKALAEALLKDSKNSHENQLVAQHIIDSLTPLSQYIGADETPSLFKLNRIQHLHRSITAEIKPQVNDLQLLLALHPTPAVGGLPRASAMSYIRQQEGYRRGWYAGACGYFGKDHSEFSVAIRSALIANSKISLFAGAGIVQGSNADAEWNELENKLATILSLLLEL
nr:isochorismate synthase [Paraferrimonas haliotis]